MFLLFSPIFFHICPGDRYLHVQPRTKTTTIITTTSPRITTRLATAVEVAVVVVTTPVGRTPATIQPNNWPVQRKNLRNLRPVVILNSTLDGKKGFYEL